MERDITEESITIKNGSYFHYGAKVDKKQADGDSDESELDSEDIFQANYERHGSF